MNWASRIDMLRNDIERKRGIRKKQRYHIDRDIIKRAQDRDLRQMCPYKQLSLNSNDCLYVNIWSGNFEVVDHGIKI